MWKQVADDLPLGVANQHWQLAVAAAPQLPVFSLQAGAGS